MSGPRQQQERAACLTRDDSRSNRPKDCEGLSKQQAQRQACKGSAAGSSSSKLIRGPLMHS